MVLAKKKIVKLTVSKEITKRVHLTKCFKNVSFSRKKLCLQIESTGAHNVEIAAIKSHTFLEKIS